jgi:Uma2 family endonuclease
MPVLSLKIMEGLEKEYQALRREPLLEDRLRGFTVDEYMRMADAGMFENEHVELLYGRVVRMSPQGREHRHGVTELAKTFMRAMGDRATVFVQSTLPLPPFGAPEPDIAIVPPGDYRDHDPTTVWLVVEVAVSSIEEDRAIKGRLYAEAGVEEYWLVDVERRRVERYLAPRDGMYTQLTTHERGETLRPQKFDDVAVPLDRILP